MATLHEHVARSACAIVCHTDGTGFSRLPDSTVKCVTSSILPLTVLCNLELCGRVLLAPEPAGSMVSFASVLQGCR